MNELRIDPEFEGKIPPLTQAEFDQLRENILEAGEVYEPIVVWNGVIVDGHNRWKVIQENPAITWKTREMQFPDKWAAFDWMYKNQLGRRNLTEAQRTYLVGKMYEARKNTHGGDRKSSTQIGNLNGESSRISDQIAKELGISHNTVTRSEHFARGIDAIRKEDPDVADDVLSGRLTPKKTDVRAIGKAMTKERQNMIEKIKNGERVSSDDESDTIAPEMKITFNGGTREYREQMNRVASAVSDIYDRNATVEYDLSDLITEIQNTAQMFIATIKNAILDHSTIAKAHPEEIRRCIDTAIIMETEKIKEGLK